MFTRLWNEINNFSTENDHIFVFYTKEGSDLHNFREAFALYLLSTQLKVKVDKRCTIDLYVNKSASFVVCVCQVYSRI